MGHYDKEMVPDRLAVFYLIHLCAFESYAVHDSDDIYGLGVALLVLCSGLSVYFGFREVSQIANAVIVSDKKRLKKVSNAASLLDLVNCSFSDFARSCCEQIFNGAIERLDFLGFALLFVKTPYLLHSAARDYLSDA